MAYDTKYIMLDSGYRNRLLYPNPAEFVVPFSATTGNSSINSINPTTVQYPLYIWRFNTIPPADNATSSQYYFPKYPFTPVSGISPLQIIGGTPANPMLNVFLNQCVGLSGYNDIPLGYSGTSTNEAVNMFANIRLYFLNTDGSLGIYYVILGYDPSLRVLSLASSLDTFTLPLSVVLCSAPYNSTLLQTNPSSVTITLMGYNTNITGFNANTDGFAVTSTTPLYVWDVTQNIILDVTLSGFFLTCDAYPDSFNPYQWATDLCCLYSAQKPLAIGNILRFGNFLLFNQYLSVTLINEAITSQITLQNNEYTTLELQKTLDPLWSSTFLQDSSPTAVASVQVDYVSHLVWFYAYDPILKIPIPFKLGVAETKNEKLWKMLGLPFKNKTTTISSTLANTFVGSAPLTFEPSVIITPGNSSGVVAGQIFTIPFGEYYDPDQLINAVQLGLRKTQDSPLGILSAVTSYSTGVAVSTFSFLTSDPMANIGNPGGSGIFSFLNIDVTQIPSPTSIIISANNVPVNPYVAFGSISDYQLGTFQTSSTEVIYPYTVGMVCRVCNSSGVGNALIQVVQLNNGVISNITMLFPGSNYACCKDNYVLVPVIIDFAGQNSELTSSTDYLSTSWATLSVEGVKPAVKIELNADYLDSDQFVGQFLFIMGTSPVYTRKRYNYELGVYETAKNPPLYTHFNNSIPPPTPQKSSFTLDQGCELYGLFPIYATRTLPIFKKNITYLQLNLITKDMYDKISIMSNLPENDTTDTQFVTRCTISNYRTDSCNPLQYTGTTVSSNQMVCYNLRIASLIIPNQQLNLPNGGLTSAYPYVFLEITNATSPSGHARNVFYSNNPNALFATFTCPISDVNSPASTNFIKLYGAGSRLVKFKPNDDLRVRLFMPDGNLFSTDLTDYLPPLPPNPLLQLSLLLEFTRL